MKYNGFKLISFEMKNNILFGDIVYNFVEERDKQDEIYTTVLIGQNGTLKSRLFQKIIYLFWNIFNLKEDKKSSFDDKFYLKYSLANNIYEFSNIRDENGLPVSLKNPIMIINGIRIDNIKKAELPLSIIAIAIMITDRFPFPKPTNFPIYQYLGSRYRPQLASSKTFISRVAEFVSKNRDSESFIIGIRKIVKEFLNSSNQLYITFYTKNTKIFFDGNLSAKNFILFFNDIKKKYKDSKNPPFKLNHYISKIENKPKLISDIVSYCTALKIKNELRDFPRSSVKAISFNLHDELEVERFRNEFQLLDHMRQLGIVSPAEIEFLKPNSENDDSGLEGYSIVESSSGEYNLIGSMVALIASIQPNSLIFIDEPEISLHPNWQMKYLSFLRELLSDEKYSSCHIIVATHSHFIISDLKAESSSVIALSRDDESNVLSSRLLEGSNTFGWSAEEVLFRVFNVKSSRNHYFEMAVAELLDMLYNKSSETNKMKRIVKQLKELNLSEDDPLNELIEETEDFIKK
jgi:hypothetical protein